MLETSPSIGNIINQFGGIYYNSGGVIQGFFHAPQDAGLCCACLRKLSFRFPVRVRQFGCTVIVEHCI